MSTATDSRRKRRLGLTISGRPDQQTKERNAHLRARASKRPTRTPHNYVVLRGYRYACVCGRSVSGFYAYTPQEARDDLANDRPSFDPKRARCAEMKGTPTPARRSFATSKTPAPHLGGCGRTMAESDAERLRRLAA